MKKINFWNDAAKWGALTGLLLGASFIAENLLLRGGQMAFYALEWILAVVAHFWLLRVAVRRRSALFSAEEGFSFNRAYGYVLAVSALAGVLLGAVQYVYTHFILGYVAYVESTIGAISQMMAASGHSSALVESSLSEVVTILRNMPEPSVFSTIQGGIVSSLFFGLTFGALAARAGVRAPKIFDSENEI